MMAAFSQLSTTVQSLLQAAKEQGLSTLDAEVLLAESLGLTRAHLYAWPEKKVESKEIELFKDWIYRREQGEPIAYILGKKEFWSLSLKVTPSVLIPRPETELLVEHVLKLFSSDDDIHLLELGTGSGAISVAIAKERPRWKIMATDISADALQVAKINAKEMSLSNITFGYGNWFGALSAKKQHQITFDLILSNPPYLEAADPHFKALELAYEPRLALEGGEDGLKDIRKLIEEAPTFLKPKGWLILEHGYNQGDKVFQHFMQKNYLNVETHKDLAGVNRMTVGQKKMA
jgi:release factor glutamine methyltransferase